MIEKKLKEILKKNNLLNVNFKNISCDDDLFQYGLNSVNIIEMVVSIEDEFEIEFNEDDLTLEKIKTINKIKKYIKNRINHN